MTRNIFRLLILLGAMSRCTNEKVYTAIQQNRQSECQKLPQPQYEECMKDYDQSYDEYAKDREDTLKDEQ